jgi:uncharacterized integral membrane protein (TIGR00697 family)
MRFNAKSAFPFVFAMTVVVVVSNILVQFPVNGQVGPVSLADILTWGAFSYPFAFLVTDLANRRFGASFARRIVFAGFVVAVICSLVVPPFLLNNFGIGFESEPGRLARIAMASGSAFLIAQLLDVSVFNRLRRQSWWRAPIVSSLAGSLMDTMVFFSIAFAAWFVFAGPGDGFASEPAAFMGAFAFEMPRWVSWAVGDLGVKLLIAMVALVPYRILMARFASEPELA